ncbi:MAG: hypothetical protein ABJE66_01370 [Deltaproteobacteria bacterium]
MRTFAFIALFVAACTAPDSPTSPAPSFASVHDRLATEPTRLFIPGDGSTGSLVAAHYTSGGWVSGTSNLTIDNGELVAKLAGDQLVAQSFDVAFAPIDLPESLFGKPAQLVDVRVTLATSATAAASWTDPDDATTSLPLELDLSWSIAIDHAVTPLGTQHLPVIPLELTLAGGGDHVDGAFAIHAMGDLWSWAGLLELSEIDLDLTGATVDQ